MTDEKRHPARRQTRRRGASKPRALVRQGDIEFSAVPVLTADDITTALERHSLLPVERSEVHEIRDALRRIPLIATAIEWLDATVKNAVIVVKPIDAPTFLQRDAAIRDREATIAAQAQRIAEIQEQAALTIAGLEARITALGRAVFSKNGGEPERAPGEPERRRPGGSRFFDTPPVPSDGPAPVTVPISGPITIERMGNPDA
jgi:hypothetical protein